MQSTATLCRVRVRISGAVQGVGFRPFVYRLASEMGVAGWIVNGTAGVIIEAEASEDIIALFTERIRRAAPARAVIHSVETDAIDPDHSTGFRIRESDSTGTRTAAVLPDIATCDECLAEVLDTGGRRAGYAFTNCTNCGPRFTIIRAVPYDRVNTTMAAFAMCDHCRGEYRHALDRRFHAQPNACPVCGPRLALHDPAGVAIECSDVIDAAAAALRAGHVLAVKGLGGYHLMVDATSEAAVARLRERKSRPTKPLAIMAGSLDDARRIVQVDDAAASLLRSPEAPIVLLPRLAMDAALTVTIAEGVAPGNPFVGVMLPATPLHHLLARAFGGPLVATSGNRSDEPICTDNAEAFRRLGGIADLFLTHDRPIERHVDDSVMAITDGMPTMLRRARGFAPLPVLLREPVPDLLAVGPHLKNTVALSTGRQVVISQHIGDLETPEAQHAFERATSDLVQLYGAAPVAVAHDMHPDYVSTHYAHAIAARRGLQLIAVQHHHAHMVSCMAENDVQEQTLGLVWDGTGYGMDGTIWGGEALLGDAHGFVRFAHLLPFRLPGGEAAVREPWRLAASLLFGLGGRDSVSANTELRRLTPRQLGVLFRMMETGTNSPVTSSAGRLFDGIAALLGLCDVVTFEGEAAIRLEHAADLGERGTYDIATTSDGGAIVLDWRTLVSALLNDRNRGVSTGVISARVHNTMVRAMAAVADMAGCERVALSGGCFQNRILAERTAGALRRRGFQVLQHRQVPANDGGVSLGQVLVAAARLRDN